MAERPFQAYSGDQPYIFVSYSHDDEDSVFDELRWLHEKGLNIWYDEGISPGSNWSDALASALDGCAHFVFFVTPNSTASQNCLDEIGFALERNKPLLAVHLTPTDLPAGLALRLGSRQAVMKFDHDQTAFRAKVIGVLGDYVAAPSAAPDTVVHSTIEKMCSSMAILPFENRTQNSELDALGETVSDELTNYYGGVWMGRKLFGGRETAQFQEQHASSKEVADAFDVGLVLNGSLRQLGDNVRIIVDIANCDGERVWSHRFDEAADTIFDREDYLVDMILWGMANGVRAYLFGRTAETPATELGPWGLSYKAWRISSNYAQADTRAEVRELLERAVSLDPEPNFRAMLAFQLANWVMQGFSDNREQDSRRAIELATEASRDGVGMTLINCGHAFGFLGDHDRAVALCRRGYEMVPRFVPSKWTYALRLLYAGRADEALKIYAEAERVKLPGQTSPYGFISQAHAIAGDLDSAIAAAKQASDEGLVDQHIIMSASANALARAGRIDEAAAAVQAIREMIPRFTIRGSINAYRRVYGTEEARQAVTSGLQELMDLGYE